MESMKFSVDEMVREIYTKMDSVDDLLSQVDIGTDIKNLSDDESQGDYIFSKFEDCQLFVMSEGESSTEKLKQK